MKKDSVVMDESGNVFLVSDIAKKGRISYFDCDTGKNRFAKLVFLTNKPKAKMRVTIDKFLTLIG
jgi:hypothetical protein